MESIGKEFFNGLIGAEVVRPGMPHYDSPLTDASLTVARNTVRQD